MSKLTEESIKRCCPPDIVEAFYKSIESYLDWQIKAKVALGLLVLPLSEEQACIERRIAVDNAINWVMQKYYNPYRIEDGYLRSNKWCKDITGEYSYTSCEKLFAYRKYF